MYRHRLLSSHLFKHDRSAVTCDPAYLSGRKSPSLSSGQCAARYADLHANAVPNPFKSPSTNPSRIPAVKSFPDLLASLSTNYPQKGQWPPQPPGPGVLSRRSRAAQSGFTLIELLVVIAIIALLAAILFPVFARARENARRSSCQSNLKQIGIGITQYTQDYDERWPLRYYGTEDGGEYNLSYNPGASDYFSWVDAIQPYTKSTQVFLCPSNSRKLAHCAPSSACTFPDTYDYSATPSAYTLNQNDTDGGPGLLDATPTDGAKALSQFGDTAGTIVVWDFGKMNGFWPAADYVALFSGDPAGNANADYVALARRHLEGLNALFADGHVKFRKTAMANEFTLTGED